MDNILLAIDPVAFSIGPLSVRWYGIIIVTGIIIAYFVAQAEGKNVDCLKISLEICCFGQCRFPYFVPAYIMSS